MNCTATLLAGIPLENKALFHRVRFGVGDPAAWIRIEENGQPRTQFIVRDIEVDRAKKSVQADAIGSPGDFAPATGLSGDRATATAQAVVECLRRAGVSQVTTDRTLPFIFAWHVQEAGIDLRYSAELGVLERRTKDDDELRMLQEAQAATEEVMLSTLQIVARAEVDNGGMLLHAGKTLTCEWLQQFAASEFLARGYSTPHGSIVATTPATADCHERGSGTIRTGEAVIIDLFPVNDTTHYCGDCTRTVVHGTPSDEMIRMHAAVVAAKAAATAAAVKGASGDDVHNATTSTLSAHGYRFDRGAISDEPVMPHGTGHGIGLEVHEPILLDLNGGRLLEREVLTIEPGLYSRKFGGVRVEDMVVIESSGPARSFNKLPEGLDWR